ncbi:MAG: Ig-like domain repeat protein [Acidobacteriota bacterium]
MDTMVGGDPIPQQAVPGKRSSALCRAMRVVMHCAAILASFSFTACSGSSNSTLPTSGQTTLATQTTLTVSPTAGVYGTSVALTATVSNTSSSPASPVNSGTVTFYDGSTSLGTGTLSGSGAATLTLQTLPVGADTLTAAFAAQGNYAASTSAAVTETITGASMTTTLTASPTSVAQGASETLTATVTSSDGTPTGTVTFSDASGSVGMGTLNAGGMATLVLATLPAGTDSLTATFTAQGNYGASTSAAVTVSVTAGNAVSAPAISPTAATISGTTPVYITDSAAGTTIYYTLDGSNPSATNGASCEPSSTTPCFSLLGAATVKAVAISSSNGASSVTSQTYTAPSSSNDCTGWNPQNIFETSDFTADQATVTSNGATLGVDCNGGGYVNYLNTGYGSFGNTIAVAYGRGFQADIRDSLHNGLYNPTEAGIDDGDGTPVTLSLTNSSEGAGGRINIVPYNMGLFLNPGFCFFPLSYYYPTNNNGISTCTSDSNTDGIWTQELAANISPTQQLLSEFQMQGYYQDAGDRGNNAASIFEYNWTMTYAENPGEPGNPGALIWESPQTSSDYSPIYKFGPSATYIDNGASTSVLSTAYEGSTYNVNAYSDVTNTSSLKSVTPTNTDLVIAQVDTGLRVRLDANYTDYMALNASCTGWTAPQSVNLQSSSTAYSMIYPVPSSSPCKSVLALENPSDSNAPIVAMYFPQTDPVNVQQVTETNVNSGASISLDRRYHSYIGANTYINANNPDRVTNGITYVNQFTQLIPLLRVTGLLAPNHAGENIDESLHMDVYVLIGSPTQVLTALQNMNKGQGWNW